MKPQEPHLVQFAAVLHQFITFLGSEPKRDEAPLELSEGLDSADFENIFQHVLIVQKRLGHIAMVCLGARVSKYADLFSEVLVPCLRARDSDDPAEKKVTWSPTGLVNVEEETCREDEIALQALITHYMEAMLLGGAPLKLVSDTKLKIPEGKIMYPFLALLPTLGNLAIHGKRYVDLASRHVEDFNDFVVHAENFKLYVVAMSRAKGAIEKIEDDAAQHVIQVLCSTLTCGMQSLVEKVLKQLSDTFDKLRLSLESEDLDIDKALEANMSGNKFGKMFKSSGRKEFKNLWVSISPYLELHETVVRHLEAACANTPVSTEFLSEMLAKSPLAGESHTKLLMDAKVRYASLAALQAVYKELKPGEIREKQIGNALDLAKAMEVTLPARVQSLLGPA
jgi:hypothetical protein